MFRFIIKLRKAAGEDIFKYMANAHTPFVAMENISLFNKAAMEYGLEEEATFQSADLYEANHKGALLNIINCLNRLGFVVSQAANNLTNNKRVASAHAIIALFC